MDFRRGRREDYPEIKLIPFIDILLVIVIFLAVFLMIATHDGEFLDASFEVVSAFGTVGLSRGFTGQLTDIGRVIIVVVMFLGRVGPLTLGFLLATRTPARVRYPAGVIHLG